MGDATTRTRTIWKHDRHGTYAVAIIEPASWWRRQWERLLDGIELFGDIAGSLFYVLWFALLIALALYSLATGPQDGTDTDPGTPSATFSSWPPPTPPTTPVTAPIPQRY
jgi:hypothetical protein